MDMIYVKGVSSPRRNAGPAGGIDGGARPNAAAATSIGAAAGRVPGPDDAVVDRIQAARRAAAALTDVEGAAVRVFALFGPTPGAAGRDGEGTRRAPLQEDAVGGAAIVAQIGHCLDVVQHGIVAGRRRRWFGDGVDRLRRHAD